MKKYSKQDLQNSLGIQAYEEMSNIIPGGAQLFSKRQELFASNFWPSYYTRSKGISVWDLNDREFIDFSIMGVGASILGYANEDVDNRVIESIRSGIVSSLNSYDEVLLSEKLLELHPWFDMVRYSKSGGEAVSIAIRIARAYTKKEIIYFNGYHGWTDWYLSSNLSDENNLDDQLMPGLKSKGIPRGLADTAFPFDINDLDKFEKELKRTSSKTAAVIIEPARGKMLEIEILRRLKEICSTNGVVLIFDEITTGMRVCLGGSHIDLGIYPDIAVYAKSISNGYPISIVIGKGEVMEAANECFISSTNWTERMGFSACLETFNQYKKNNVSIHINKIGKKVKEIWMEASKKYNIEINVSGIDSLASFSFMENNDYKSKYFTVEMLQRGYLGFRQFKPSMAHTNEDLVQYKDAVEESFKIISSLDEEKLKSLGKVQSFFGRITKE